ncbi:MAG: hypothetical protein K2N16_02250, partial [Muribaculaceae bacterium]|nr:hypothetical protein [Muribaculaceae bacterium]
MKRVQLLVLALVAVLTAGAATKNSTPDFAFPQTVDKDARRDLNTAIKAKDAHAALNALIRVYVANEVIGEQGAAQQSIELAESTAQKFAGNPLEGMFDALMARMYNDEYAKQRWVYDEREMPLEPRPSDITEWSGKQYKHVIDSLLDRSVVTPSGLSALRIGDYADIVEANKLTQTYYPTLFDFACSNAIVISNGIDQSPLKYCQAGVTSALKRQSVPAEVLWRCKWIEYNGRSNKEICEAYKALFLSMKDSEYASLPLAEYIKKAESSN